MAETAGWKLWSIKDVKMHDKFSGEDGDFEPWSFSFEAEVEAMGWKNLLDIAKASQEPVMNEHLQPAQTELSKNLYFLLTQVMKGKSQPKVKNAGSGQGFEAIRLLYEAYRPRGKMTSNAMMTAIIHPTWWANEDHRGRVYIDVLADWENVIAEFEIVADERISNLTKCSTVLAHAPNHVKKMLGACHKPAEGADQGVLPREVLRKLRAEGPAFCCGRPYPDGGRRHRPG